ncbi:thermonuclease family protein [bacterium]|nr:thermonuclease family protein [bacterium]
MTAGVENFRASTLHPTTCCGDTKLLSLYQCVQFARAFPILNARSELTWAHCRVLTQVENQAERKAIEAKAAKNKWTSRELEDHVWPEATTVSSIIPFSRASGNGSRLLAPKRGVMGLYRIDTRTAQGGLTADDADGADTSRRLGFGTNIRGIRAIRGQPSSNAVSLALDLGFTSYLDLTAAEARGLNEGDLVHLAPSGRITPAKGAKRTELYTYPAEVLRVVDGDTLWMRIYLRPRHWLKEKLRLRAIDCPELDTAKGRSAKGFVQALVRQATAVTITTTKPDKWDRYLSNIFLKLPSGEDVFLNNGLLETGHAVRKTSYVFDDWSTDLR